VKVEGNSSETGEPATGRKAHEPAQEKDAAIPGQVYAIVFARWGEEDFWKTSANLVEASEKFLAQPWLDA